MKKVIDVLKRNRLIILILCIAVVAFSVIMILLQRNGDIIKTARTIFREEVTEDNIICSVYDNTNDTIKALVTVQRVEGIDSIEYLNNQEENIKINCNGKKKVSIDKVLELNKQYNFKVTSNGEEITETILLDESYIDEYIKISDLENEESNYSKVGIGYNNKLSETTKQYKLGNGAWTEYTSEFEISPENLVLQDIIDNKATLYGRQVDAVGNTIITSGKEYSGFGVKYLEKFDVFEDVSKMGQTVEQYGFTATWNNSEKKTFTIKNFRASHHSGGGNYSGTFKLNSPLFKNIRAEELHIGSMLYASGGYAQAKATVYYTDGTSKSVQTSQIKSSSYKSYPMTITLEDKEISYIEMTILRKRCN